MKAIRGAITVSEDTASAIRESVSALLNEIKIRNNLDEQDIIFIMFSNTADIKSFYPAKAAREAGFGSAALFSALEPDIAGSLEKCIRVMVLVENDSQPRHVYLGKAAALRRDITKKYNVAIDGPAGSGKSTVAKIIAQRLGILYLDTGAMYRACALKCSRAGADCADERAVMPLMSDDDIEIKYENGAQRVYLDGKDVSEEIRLPEISMLASTVSAHGCVRSKMVDLQRKIAAQSSCVLDGRDIGTNVLPKAEYKFYLTASAEVRAKRRTAELEAKGIGAKFGEVLAEIVKRDKQDATRKIAPLKKADDATEIDTSDIDAEQVARLIINKIQEKI